MLTIGVIQPTNGQGILEALLQLGCNPVQLSPARPWPDMPCDLYLLPGPFFPLGPLLPRIAALPKARVVVWLTEQHPSPAMPAWLLRAAGDGLCQASLRPGAGGWRERLVRWRLPGEVRWLKRHGLLRLLAVSTPSHRAFFEHKIGVPAQEIPFGCCADYGACLNFERDTDAIFLGSLRDARRRHNLQMLETQLAARGVKLAIHDGSSRERREIYGIDRTWQLNRARVMISLMRQPWDDLVFRMFLAAANGCLLVSEPVIDRRPFQNGVHFVSAPLEQLPELVEQAVKTPERFAPIRQAAHALAVEQMSMLEMTRRLLQAAEVLGEPA